MRNENTVPEAVYIRPAVLCRITLATEEIRIESATVDKEGEGRALLVFRTEEEAEEYRREEGLYPEEEGFKVLPVDDDMLRYPLEIHQCTQVVAPISWIGEGMADFYTVENFMRILESAVPA